MNIAVHAMEPWLVEYQNIEYNLGQSGMEDKMLGEILEITGTGLDELSSCSLRDNDTYGSIELRKAIASFYDGVDLDKILVTTGSSEALFIYFQLRYEPGANIIIPFPAFQTLYEVPRYIGYEVRYLHLKPENGFRIDMNELKNLVDNKTKIIVLNNPHNPTGMRLTVEEIADIKKISEKYNIEILADEHYRFMPYDNSELIPSLYNETNNVVASGSMIKCFGCVGLRVGWIIGPRELIESCRDFKDYTTHTICSVNDLLAKKVLMNWKKIMDTHKQWVLKNVSQFNELIDKHKEFIDWVEPQGGIVAFPFIKDKTVVTEVFAKSLIEKANVFVLPGEVFEKPGYFRICLGINPEKFSRAMHLMSKFIAERGWEV